MTFSQSSLSNSISAPHIPLPQHLKGWDLTLTPPPSYANVLEKVFEKVAPTVSQSVNASPS